VGECGYGILQVEEEEESDDEKWAGPEIVYKPISPLDFC
jgi:hypothetical protein